MRMNKSINNFEQVVPVSYTLGNHVAGDITASVDCKLSDSQKTKWKKETFNAIIKAYEDVLAVYNNTLAEKQTEGVQILGTNPLFYREIENTILRKNCISYLIDQTPTAKRTYGKSFLNGVNTFGGNESYNFV